MSPSTPVRKRVSAPRRRELLVAAADRVFADLGFQGAGVEAIAHEAGVTVPVLYDHFRSKAELYRELVGMHYQSLRQIWFRHAAAGTSFETWLGPAVEEWFAYVEAHPFAGRMLFHEATGDPGAAGEHERIQNASRTEVIALLRGQVIEAGVDPGDDVQLELAWETLRAILQGLAIWWRDRPEVPRERIVEAALNAIWLGFGRVMAGERWAPG